MRGGRVGRLRVLVAGQRPLAEDVLALCLNAGHAATFYLTDGAADGPELDDLRPQAAQADLAIECHDESRDVKLRLISALVAAPVLYVSALSCSRLRPKGD